MKKQILFFTFILFGIKLIYSQNTFPASGSVGIGTITPNSTALLDISSTAMPYKGVLIPRLTQAQRTSIVSPATGLLIYQTNATPGFYYYNGAAWTPVTPAAGANRNLSNLLATSVNQHLLPAANNSRDIGSNAKKWRNVYLYNLKFPDATTQSTAALFYSGGTGISVVGSTINNTSPDQTITLTQGGATTITGTYPNFNISSTDNNTTYTAGSGLLLTGTEFSNTSPDQIVTLTGAGTTSISGTYPDFTISSTAGGSGWSLSGNSGTIDGVDFIGTTDYAPINFRVNNENVGRIDVLWANTFLGYQSGNSGILGLGGGGNAGFGVNVLYSNTYGILNTASGQDALYSNIDGAFNTASGYASLYSNINGQGNTAIGSNALGSNSIGNNNTAIGSNALSTNSTGNNNTAVGYNATVGFGDLTNATAIGYNASVNSSNAMVLGGLGADAVKVGIGNSDPAATLDIVGNIKIADGTQGPGKVLTSDADGLASWSDILIPPPAENAFWSLNGNSGTADGIDFIGTTDSAPLNFRVNNEMAGRIDPLNQNTFYGIQAGNATTTGFGNTANGFHTLCVNTTGNGNTANGYYTLNSNTEGYVNTANGWGCLSFNTIGYYNVAIGGFALYQNTEGYFNNACGNGALFTNTLGYNNNAIGASTLYSNTIGNNNNAFGFGALELNTIGNRNNAFGDFALYSNIDGNYNSALGSSAFYFGDSYSNSTALGYNSSITSSDQIRLGNSAIMSIGGQVSWTTVSDQRFKKDINDNVPGLEFINKLHPVTYYLNMNAIASFLKTPDSLRLKESEQLKGSILQTGFIAQEVEKAAEEIDYDFSGVDKPKNENDYYGLRYAEFVVPLVKSVQELDSINKDQNDEIENLQLEIDLLQQQIELLSSTINSSELNDGVIQLGTQNSERTQNPSPMLGQNVPNPFDNSTLIPFRIPSGCKDASIMIINLNEGKVITVIPISCNETHISFDAGELASGNYTYTLIVDGNIVDTKQMELIK